MPLKNKLCSIEFKVKTKIKLKYYLSLPKKQKKMLIKTQAIILNTLKHSDKTTIVNSYSRHFGRISFAVFGTHGRKSSVRTAHLQPLSVVELDVMHVPGRDIQRIKDLKMEIVFCSIPFDPVKSAIALFFAEMLSKVLRQPEEDEPLFNFLMDSVNYLDNEKQNFADFHLIFLLKLTQYLGFYPNFESNEIKYFDLMNGVFEQEKPSHTHYLSDDYAQLFYSLLNSDYNETGQLNLRRNTRKILLNAILDYYRLHVSDFHGLKSLSVFQSLFD